MMHSGSTAGEGARARGANAGTAPDDAQGACVGARSVAFVTLGCAKNEVDTAHMMARARQAGYDVVDDPEHASAIVVNTCSFIQAATEESLEAIFDVAGLPNVEGGRAKLVVAGCMPARYGADLKEELVEACAFLPCSREDDIVAVLDDALGPRERAGGPCPATAAGGAQGVAGAQGPTFAYVKISDGCDRFCSYCTIPLIRGRYHSFSFDEVRAEVAERVGEGAREIVLIAQDTGRWGQDLDVPSSLAELVASLAEQFPAIWFRFMYLQPEGVTDELLQAVATHENVCPYFDIPLQHVDPSLLRAMNRRGGRQEFEALLERIRRAVPDVTLRTTLMAGFPGETEAQFDDLCDFVASAPFDYVGVFPYSREEGTRAFDMPNQVDGDEKAQRAQQLRDIADAACAMRIAARVGREADVLVEGFEEDGQCYGRAMCQAPEVDGVTYLEAGAAGDVVRVRIADTLLYDMEGE